MKLKLCSCKGQVQLLLETAEEESLSLRHSVRCFSKQGQAYLMTHINKSSF